MHRSILAQTSDAPLPDGRPVLRDGRAALPDPPVPATGSGGRKYCRDMCWNIHTVHQVAPATTDEDIRADALPHVRKVSGSTEPGTGGSADPATGGHWS